MALSKNLPATRAAALTHLEEFLPQAGAYARLRNFDYGPDKVPAVSQLSPYLRHRLLLESEVVDAVESKYERSSVSKFIQEVYWRTYWKGWLEQRPQVWEDYSAWLADASGPAAASTLQSVDSYQTGIECFDAWTRELEETGYLHNHARMWYASIWIFTLKLPWQLGAQRFLRHLLDGDAASNTLSWRWVAGLHTKGKHYLARADNIAEFTEGRFNPSGQLNQTAAPITEAAEYTREPLELSQSKVDPAKKYALLICDDDCAPECSELKDAQIVSMAALRPASALYSELVAGFKEAALKDAVNRSHAHFGCSANDCFIGDAAELTGWFESSGADSVFMLKAPVGHSADQVESIFKETEIPQQTITRSYDAALWPKASAGYFKFKKSLNL